MELIPDNEAHCGLSTGYAVQFNIVILEVHFFPVLIKPQGYTERYVHTGLYLSDDFFNVKCNAFIPTAVDFLVILLAY